MFTIKYRAIRNSKFKFRLIRSELLGDRILFIQQPSSSSVQQSRATASSAATRDLSGEDAPGWRNAATFTLPHATPAWKLWRRASQSANRPAVFDGTDRYISHLSEVETPAPAGSRHRPRHRSTSRQPKPTAL